MAQNTEQMTQNTQQFIEEMNAHRKQKGDILKEEEEEAYQEEPSSTYWPPQGQEEESSPIYDHSYSHQQYQEEPPSPTMAALKETKAVTEEMSAALERTMSTFLSEAEGDRQEFARINNSITQSYEKMDAHFKQIMDILKEEEC